MKITYLGDWDERYHALVAKNLSMYPAVPILRLEPIMAYDYKAWCCNHIWLHKPPLFLYQMALSMKIFGVSLISARLPSVLMGTLLIYLVYRITTLIYDSYAGLWASLLCSTSYYLIGLCNGITDMDHNDMAFLFYNTISIWAFYEFIFNPRVKWLYILGIATGLAILCKWMAALLPLGVMAIFLIINKYKLRKQYLIHITLSSILGLVLALSWYIYIFKYYPKESSFEMSYNASHLWKVIENHSGNVLFYLGTLIESHGIWFLIMIIWGSYHSFIYHKRFEWLWLLLFIGVPYLVFSLAATKMPGYVIMASPLFFAISAYGLTKLGDRFGEKSVSLIFMALVVSVLNMHPMDTYKNYCFESRPRAITKKQNAVQYSMINQKVPQGYTLWNVKGLEDIDAMFFADRNVYSWCMTEPEYKLLKSQGVKIAVVNDHGAMKVPQYLRKDSSVIMVDLLLK
jgi:4-amino-4-deoxy-L-arabinose transferase